MNNLVANALREWGYAFHSADLMDPSQMPDIETVFNSLDHELYPDPAPGRRHRVYGRMELHREVGLTPLPNVPYIQYKNQDAQGKPRDFRAMSKDVLQSKTMAYWVRHFVPYAKAAVPAIFEQEAVKVGLHLISYRPIQGPGGPSFASPSTFHTDDERYVAVLLLRKTSNLGGGENEIEIRPSEIHDIVSLERSLEVLSVTQACKHNVRAMYTKDGCEARRDVLLVTYD